MPTTEKTEVTVVTAKELDDKGCPQCGARNSTSTQMEKQEELKPEFQVCGNIYQFECHACHQNALAVSADTISDALRSALNQCDGTYITLLNILCG